MFSSNRKFDLYTFELSKFYRMSEVGAPLKIRRKYKYKTRRIENPITRRLPFGTEIPRYVPVRFMIFRTPNVFRAINSHQRPLFIAKGNRPGPNPLTIDRTRFFSRPLVISPIRNGHPTDLSFLRIFFFCLSFGQNRAPAVFARSTVQGGKRTRQACTANNIGVPRQ